MANPFTFNGVTIYAPGILVRSSIGANRVLQLLPFGTVMLLGCSNGGTNGVYSFFSYEDAKNILRGGALLQAFEDVVDGGGATQFICVIVGTKTGSTLRVGNAAAGTVAAAITAGSAVVFTPSSMVGIAVGSTLVFDTGSNMETVTVTAVTGTTATATFAHNHSAGVAFHSTTAGATVASGDTGSYTTGIEFGVVTGTNNGTFAALVTYVDANGVTNTVGGPGSDLDNCSTWSAMAAAIAADRVITPNDGLTPPIITMTVTVDGTPVTSSLTALAGGTGDGTATPTFSQVQAGVNSLADIAWDIGHLVGVYDSASQAYLDGVMQQNVPYCRLQRQIAQIQPSGVSPANTKAQNSLAVRASGVAAAAVLDSERTSIVAQQAYLLNKNTGLRTFRDAAPTLCGMAASLGATGAWGPATPLTYSYLPGATAVDYPILDQTGDRDLAVKGGLWGIEAVGSGVAQQVRVISSVTTLQAGPGSTNQDFCEFSVVRVSDALLANMKAAVEVPSPKAIGGGNDLKTMNGILAEAQDVLELAQAARWITSYDKTSVVINMAESDADILKYSASPTRPLNKLGVDQTLLPYQTNVSLSSAVTS